MALSTCIKCGHSSFELKENEPTGSNFKVFMVQCSKCGGVVGVLPFLEAGQIARENREILKKIASKLSVYL